MATTTFSGPIRAGTIKNTTGIDVQDNIANVGYVVMSQSAGVTQAGNTTSPATTIVIPANSRILSCHLYVTAVFSGAASTAGLGFDDGTVVTAAALTAATGVAGGTLGIIEPTAGANLARIQNWDNTGTNAKRIRLLPTNTGTGTGILVVNYVQAVHTAIRP